MAWEDLNKRLNGGTIPTAMTSQQPQPAVEESPKSAYEKLSGWGKIHEDIKAEEPAQTNILGGVADIGKLLYDVPVQTAGAVGALFEEEDPFEKVDWKDTVRNAARQRLNLRQQELLPSERRERLIPGTDFLTRGDIQEASASTGFTAATLGSQLAASLPLILAPVPGARPAGIAAGMAAGATTAFRIDKNTLTVELLEQAEAAKGSPLSKEERKILLDETEDIRSNHALWEAGPEAIGNALSLTGIGSIFKGAAKAAVPKMITGLVTALGGELGTETVTQMGQQRAEAELGLTDQPPRSWTELSDWAESFMEIAPQTILLTGLMGGGGAISGAVSKTVSESKSASELAQKMAQKEQVYTEFKQSNPTDQELEQLRNNPAQIEERGLFPEHVEGLIKKREENAAFLAKTDELAAAGKLTDPVRIKRAEAIRAEMAERTAKQEEAQRAEQLEAAKREEAERRVLFEEQKDKLVDYTLSDLEDISPPELERLGITEEAAKEAFQERRRSLEDARSFIERAKTERALQRDTEAIAEAKGIIDREKAREESRFERLEQLGFSKEDIAKAKADVVAANKRLGQREPTQAQFEREIERRATEEEYRAYEPEAPGEEMPPGSRPVTKETSLFARGEKAAGEFGSLAEKIDRAKFPASLPAMVSAGRLKRIQEAEETFSNLIPDKIRPAINVMEMEMKEGEVGQRFKKQDGTWGGVKTTNPKWMQVATLKRYDEANGTQLQNIINKKNVSKIISKVKADGVTALTDRQRDAWNYISKSAEDLKETHPTLIAADTFERADKQGIDISEPRDITVGETDPGDTMLITNKKGIPEIFTHEGFDEKGNSIFRGETGQEIVNDPFEKIQVIGIKKGEGRELTEKVNSDITKIIPRIANVDDALWFKSEIEKSLQKTPQLAPYADLYRTAIDKQLLGLQGEERTKFKEALGTQVARREDLDQIIKTVQAQAEERRAVSEEKREGRVARVRGEREAPGRPVPVREEGGREVEAGGVLQEAPRETPEGPSEVKFSAKAEEQITNANVEEELKAFIGDKQLSSLINSGRLTISNETPVGANVKAVINRNDNITIYSQNITKGKAVNVLAHELGVHYGYEQIFGDKASGIFKRFAAFKDQKGKIGEAVSRAYMDVPADTPKNIIDEEALAYFVENKDNYNLPLHRQIIAAIKAWLVKTLGVTPKILNTDDMVAIAVSALRKGDGKVAVKIGIDKLSMSSKITENTTVDLSEVAEPKDDEWFNGSLTMKSAAERGSVYLTKDAEQTAIYGGNKAGGFYKYTIKKDAKILDTSNSDEIKSIVDLLFKEVDDGEASIAIDEMVAQAIDNANGNTSEAKEILMDELSPEEILTESIYDEGALQEFLTEKFNYDVVIFSGEDTAILLNSESAVEERPFLEIQDKKLSKAEFKPVTAATTETPPFKRWFGNSKILSPAGKPAIVYHGSPQVPTEFSLQKLGKNTGSPMANLGVFFASDRNEALGYSRGTGNVGNFFLRMEKPFVVESIAEIPTQTVEQVKSFRKYLISLGYDGIVVKDEGHLISFSPRFVKSAELGTGEFDITKTDVRYSKNSTTNEVDNLFPEMEDINEEFYKKNRQTFRSPIRTALRETSRFAREALEGVDKFLGSISTRLGNIDPDLKYKIRRLDFNISLRSKENNIVANELFQKTKKMSKADLADWDLARKNRDTSKINDLVKKYDIKKEYDAVNEMIESIRNRAYEAGLEINKIDDYWPRVLKDKKGFLEYLQRGNDWPVFSQQIRAKEKEMGLDPGTMPIEEQANIVNNLLLGHGMELSKPTHAKVRKISVVSPELNKYYMTSDGALVSYIFEMNKNIEARNFFGKVPARVREIRTQLNAVNKKINAAQKEAESTDVSRDTLRLDEVNKKINRYLSTKIKLENYLEQFYLTREDHEASIGQFLVESMASGKLKPGDESTVREILMARFSAKGTHGIIGLYKNMSYIDTMGSVTSAITQIGDLSFSLYAGGLRGTAKGLINAIRGKSMITREDLGLENIAQEFEDSGTSAKWVTTVFKATGLEKMDAIGKETLINATMEKAMATAADDAKNANLKAELKEIFGEQSGQVLKDLKNKDITEDVLFYAWNKLADFQPISLAEYPQKYLDAGNGRLFYMLKSYTLKMFDVHRRESIGKIIEGTRTKNASLVKEGTVNMVKLAALLVIANATADELKDFLLGRETDIQDTVVDNVLRLFGVGKYVVWRARYEGAGSAFVKQVAPPFKFFDALTKDIAHAGDQRGLETIGSIPLVGKIYYWRWGRGSGKRGDLIERRFAEKKRKARDLKEEYDQAKDKTRFSYKHQRALTEARQVDRASARITALSKRYNLIMSQNIVERQKEILLNNISRQKTQIMESVIR